ncbi:MAG: MerR family transcriptional regulator [Desulfovibrio sp.]|jgi:DNA-binding transcriptional MerR regulator|nr:MerR family transcriptional regulator [Desulfovibrio sp.]
MAKDCYTISQMSAISKISKKALRFYDSIGLIASKRREANNYRIYTYDDLLAVPPLKYYKQIGFHLDEIRSAFEAGGRCTSLAALKAMFIKKTESLEDERKILHMRRTSVQDWLELLYEAELVLDNTVTSVSLKYVAPEKLLQMEQDFLSDIKSSIINLEFTNHVESIGNYITGPVIIKFYSIADRLNGESQRVCILQKTVFPCDEGQTQDFGGSLMASCYHIGGHDSISETYKKLQRWCAVNRYDYDPFSYERYVTDYWTTNNEALFVTEVLLRVRRPGSTQHQPAARRMASCQDMLKGESDHPGLRRQKTRQPN